jgi:uncharacterized glyoxalase superfamily protein PhnB
MTIGIWPTLTFTDADAGIAWLKAIGFTEKEIHRDPDDPTVVVHAEMLWPTGGGVMFGSDRPNPDWPTQAGHSAAYLVTDDVDGVFAAALDAGAKPLREPRDEAYGGRGATVTDPEGNLWSFGSYAPA